MKHNCEKPFAKETTMLVITWHQLQNLANRILGKVVKAGGCNFNRFKVTHLQSWGGQQNTSLFNRDNYQNQNLIREGFYPAPLYHGGV